MNSTFGLDPVDARVARVVQQWVDSAEGAPDLMRAACTEAILEGSGSGNHAELYEHARANANGEYALYCGTAALYVVDALRDLLGDAIPQEGGPPTLAQGLFADLLDFGNRALWAEVADSYMPDPEYVWEVAKS